MRCPYCGGLNPDNTQYCIRCGRDVSAQPPAIQRQSAPVAQRPAYPPPQQPVRPVAPVNPRPPIPQQAPPYQPAQPVQQPQYPPQGAAYPPQVHAGRGAQQAPVAPQPPARVRQRTPVEAPAAVAPRVVAPEAPAPFPPKTVAQMKALEAGALAYTQVSSEIGNGKKKVVRIAYPACAAWQQVATLLKAFREYDEQKFNTVIIQGVSDRDTNIYSYTNGQFAFDRNVRLGSQILSRYQIETGNGFDTDSVRIVLSE